MKAWQWFALAAAALVALAFLRKRPGAQGGVIASLLGPGSLPAVGAVRQTGTGAPTTPGYSNDVRDPLAPSVPLPGTDTPTPQTGYRPSARTTTTLVPPSRGPQYETRSGRGHF